MRAVFLLYLLLHCARGIWRPQIIGSYSVSRAVLVVRISPPLAGASDYYVFAEREDNSDIFYEDSQVVNKSDTEFVYEVKNIPTQSTQRYIILVRPRDLHGEYLSGFKSNRTSITIPPVPATSRAVILDAPFRPTLPPRALDTTTAPPHPHAGIDLGKWLIITGSVVAFLVLVFVATMLYVGRGCRTSFQRRPSFRSSQTSQGTTISETLQPSENNHDRGPIYTQGLLREQC